MFNALQLSIKTGPFNDDPPVELMAKSILTPRIPTECLCDGRVSSLQSSLKHRKKKRFGKMSVNVNICIGICICICICNINIYIISIYIYMYHI